METTSPLKPGDRIRLYGGYDPEPGWLCGKKAYSARVIAFIDSRIKARSGDERLCAVVELDDHIEFEGLKSRHVLLQLRYRGQRWHCSGIVHINLLNGPVADASKLTDSSSRWMESHAQYETIDRT